jgi:hypothetical protein
MEKVPREFMVDVTTEFFRLKSGKRQYVLGQVYGQKASEREKCHYHEHDEENPKCA